MSTEQGFGMKPDVDYTLVADTLATFSPLTRDRAMDAIHRLHRRVRAMINRPAADVSWSDTMFEDVFTIKFEASDRLFAIHNIWIDQSPLAVEPGAFLVRRGGKLLHLASGSRSDAHFAMLLTLIAGDLRFRTRRGFSVVNQSSYGVITDHSAHQLIGVLHSHPGAATFGSEIRERYNPEYAKTVEFASLVLTSPNSIRVPLALQRMGRCENIQTQVSFRSSDTVSEWIATSPIPGFGADQRILGSPNGPMTNGKHTSLLHSVGPVDATHSGLSGFQYGRPPSQLSPNLVI